MSLSDLLQVFICRPSLDPEQSYEVLRWFRDVNVRTRTILMVLVYVLQGCTRSSLWQKEASLNSLVWSQDPTTGDPLVCVGGANSSRIDVLNVVTGGVARVRNVVTSAAWRSPERKAIDSSPYCPGNQGSWSSEYVPICGAHSIAEHPPPVYQRSCRLSSVFSDPGFRFCRPHNPSVELRPRI